MSESAQTSHENLPPSPHLPLIFKLEGMAYRVHGECDRTLTYSALVNAVGRKYGLNLSWDEM